MDRCHSKRTTHCQIGLQFVSILFKGLEVADFPLEAGEQEQERSGHDVAGVPDEGAHCEDSGEEGPQAAVYHVEAVAHFLHLGRGVMGVRVLHTI
jgi:hypothetical protein